MMNATELNIFIILVLTVFIAAWLKVKIKFADNKKTANRYLHSRFSRFVSVSVNIISFLYLAYFFMLPGTARMLEIVTVVLIIFSFAMQLSLMMDRDIFDSQKR